MGDRPHDPPAVYHIAVRDGDRVGRELAASLVATGSLWAPLPAMLLEKQSAPVPGVRALGKV